MSGEPKAQPQPMRERIVAAAVSVMAERGVTNATTKEIARQAGVSEGSLYNHFENKAELFGAAFGSVASGIRGAMQELLGSVGTNTVEENLARFATAAVHFYGDLLPMVGAVLGDREVLGWLQRTGRAGGPAQGQGGLLRYLEAEQHRGRLRDDADLPSIAAALLGACQHRAFLGLMSGEGTPDLDEYAHQLAHALLTSQLP